MFSARTWLVALSVVAAYICLIDRIAISIAIIPMVDEFGWQPTDQGAVMSAFFIGYVFLQMPAGWLADNFGGKWVLGLGVVFWSLYTALTPPAAGISLTVLIACRFLMGMAESVTFPAVYSLFTQWLAPSQRGLALGLLNSSISGGTIIALAVTPWLISTWGWPSVFYVYGALGVLWALVWFPSVPAGPPPITETAAIDAAAVADVSSPPRDLKPFKPGSLLRSRSIWALSYAHLTTNWVVFLSLAWLPTYFSRAFDLDIRAVGLLAVVPYLVSALATPWFGRLTDKAIARGVNRTRWRRGMQVLALGGAGVVLLFVGYVEALTVSIVLFSLANFCMAASVGGFAASHMDIAPNHSGTLYGLTNALASLGSAGAVYVAGVVLEWTGAWSAVFQCTALVAFSGALVYGLAGSSEREF